MILHFRAYVSLDSPGLIIARRQHLGLGAEGKRSSRVPARVTYRLPKQTGDMNVPKSPYIDGICRIRAGGTGCGQLRAKSAQLTAAGEELFTLRRRHWVTFVEVLLSELRELVDGVKCLA